MLFLFTLTNVLLLFLLWKVIRPENRSFYFNPYLSAPDSFLDRILDYASPILPGASKRLVAAIVFLFVLAFRNLLFARFGASSLAEFGGGIVFLPPRGSPELVRSMLAGTVRFIQFLLSFWGAFLIVRLLSRSRGATRTGQAFEELAAPFSRLSPWQMGLVLILSNALLGLCLSLLSCPLTQVGQGVPMGQQPSGDLSLFDHFALVPWLGMLGTLRSLLFLQELLMSLIFMSLFAILFGKQSLAIFCQEALDLSLGRLADHPWRLGSFDFTPILFYMGLSISYSFLIQALFLLKPYLPTLHL